MIYFAHDNNVWNNDNMKQLRFECNFSFKEINCQLVRAFTAIRPSSWSMFFSKRDEGSNEWKSFF